MSEQVLINGIEMKPGMEFGREITYEEAKDKKKIKNWLEEDEWKLKQK